MLRSAPPLALLAAALAVAACGDAGQGGDTDAPPDRGEETAATRPGAGATDSPGSVPSGPVDPAVICDTINNSFRCARAIEERALPSAPATRRGDTLVLELAGDTARLVDRPGEGSGVVMFSYQDHWPGRDAFVIHQQYYEGSEYLLVDRATGRRTEVPERPMLAPGGERFAVLSFDLEAGYGPNTVQIWQFTPEGPRMEWETNPDTWGPTDGRWNGPYSLEFTRACPPGGAEGTECGGRATVTQAESESGWILEVTDAEGNGG